MSPLHSISSRAYIAYAIYVDMLLPQDCQAIFYLYHRRRETSFHSTDQTLCLSATLQSVASFVLQGIFNAMTDYIGYRYKHCI